jgi:hypothetical protein
MYKVQVVCCKMYKHESPTRLDGQDKPGTPTTMWNRCVHLTERCGGFLGWPSFRMIDFHVESVSLATYGK